MKVAISSVGNSPDAKLDSRFGRCSYFVIYDTETAATEYIPNTNKDNIEGCGPASVQFVASKGVIKIVSGEFNIDMNSINCKDLTDESWNQKLVGHLKSDDFFGVAKFPTAKLVINESQAFNKDEAVVTGKLTIKGITHPLTFTAKRNGNTYESTITIDRSKYDIRYGSGKFFDNLGDNMIYDEFTLEVKLVVE